MSEELTRYLARLEANPRDVEALKRLAELKQREGDAEAAARYYAAVAEVFAEEGALLKSVALMKHVAKLDPSRIETQVRLAELHGLLQLHEEAASHLHAAAARYEQAGELKKGLELLRRFVKASPANVAARLELAELAVKLGQPQDAIKTLRDAAAELEQRGRVEEQIVVLTRLAALQPEALGIPRLLASLCMKRGDAQQAIAWLAAFHRTSAPDVETLRMAGVAFESRGEPAKAAACWKQSARLHEAAGRAGEASEAWAQVLRLTPADADAKRRRA